MTQPSLIDEVKAVRLLQVLSRSKADLVAVSYSDYMLMFSKLRRVKVAAQTVNGEVNIMSVTVIREAAIKLLKDEYGIHHARK